MFRIHFDHQTGQFVVQVYRYGLIWLTVRESISGADGCIYLPRQFPTYIEARAWVASIGLPDLYEERHPKTYKQFILNGGVR